MRALVLWLGLALVGANLMINRQGSILVGLLNAPGQKPASGGGTTGGGANPITGDCSPKKGDVKVPLPGGLHMIWRPTSISGGGHPANPSALDTLNGQLIGPCGGG